jgi:hypothetical protein
MRRVGFLTSAAMLGLLCLTADHAVAGERHRLLGTVIGALAPHDHLGEGVPPGVATPHDGLAAGISTGPPGPHRYGEYAAGGDPWHGYGFGVPTYNWGYFGAHYRPMSICHTGYYGQFVQWGYRRGY